MSCLPLSIETLAGVRETMSKNVSQTQATEFVHLAWIFNSIEYFQARHIDHEPIVWHDALVAIDNTSAERMSEAQFFKSLRCIDYNTEPKGWMHTQDYERWARREEYENFKKKIHKMIYLLALRFADTVPEVQDAQWG